MYNTTLYFGWNIHIRISLQATDKCNNFSLGKIVLSASYNRGEENENLGTFYKTIQIDVKKAKKVEVIDSSSYSINLDGYTRSLKINVEAFPVDATNRNLKFEFIPNSPALQGSIDIVNDGNEVTISLTKFDVSGQGTLRITAEDGYSAVGVFSTYIEIPINVANIKQISNIAIKLLAKLI